MHFVCVVSGRNKKLLSLCRITCGELWDSRYVLRVPRPGAGGAGGAGGVCRGDSSSSPVRGASQSTQ